MIAAIQKIAAFFVLKVLCFTDNRRYNCVGIREEI